MNANHRELISISLTVGIISLTLFIIHRFIPSLLWASIIVIATYPLYQRWQKLLGAYPNISALLFTLVMVFLFILPLSWLISILVKELQYFITYLQQINRHGGQAPIFIRNMPFLGKELVSYWDKNISHPGNVKNYFAHAHMLLAPGGYYLKQLSLNVAHRSFQVGFTLMSLFFFYRDGDLLFKQINHIGHYCLGIRWDRYAYKLPAALRATVNGTIVVGVGVGILMGLCYWLVGFPAPTLLGFITAFAAMIPFVVPVVFAIVALILVFNNSMIAAIVVIAWGTLVVFVADHFIKPVLIGGAIQLPFLAVLFGILGGIETLGLLGLFLGPIVMVLFITLWHESQDFEKITHIH